VLNDAAQAMKPYLRALAASWSIRRGLSLCIDITRQSLAIVDISVPTAPRLIKEVRSPNGANGFWMAGCRDVVINEAAGVAYVAAEYTNDIAVIDISVPATDM